MSKLDALTNFAVFIKFMRKEGFSMKKMLAKAVVLGLVLGGVGFVANDAQAADIGNGVKVHVEKHTGIVLAEPGLQTSLATQANLAKVDKVAEDAKAAAGEANTKAEAAQATANEAKDAAAKNAEAIKTKADAWYVAGKLAKVQEMFNNQDSKNAELDKKNGEQDAAINANGQAIATNKDAIKANADAIAANKADADQQHIYFNTRIEHNTKCIDDNKLAIKKETADRVKADEDLSDRIDTNKENIAANKTAIEQEVTDRKAEVARLDGEVSRLDSRIDKLDANVEKVGAMAAAIANLHTMGYDPKSL